MAAQTEGARARRCAHRSTAFGFSGAPKLADRGAKEREEHGELGSCLTRARAVAWRPGDGGAEPEAAALGGSEARAWREVKRGWERCGEVQGWCSPFYRCRGNAGEGWSGFNAGVNGFNAIEDRGGGLRRELGGEMKAGGNGSAAPEAWSWAARGGRRVVAVRESSGGRR
jgi:hypothetical protein